MLRRIGFPNNAIASGKATNETGKAQPEIFSPVTTGAIENLTSNTKTDGKQTSEHKPKANRILPATVLLGFLLFASIGVGLWFYGSRAANIESIAVIPFVNESGNADVEYLSDGMTELLINSLSELPKLSVKARSSVFHYKGNRERAQATLAELKSFAAENFVPAYNFAMIYNGLGEKEEALNYLEKSFQEREVQITFIKVDIRWDDFRPAPRFLEIIKRMNLE